MNPNNPIGIAAGLAITLLCLSGCTPSPAPTATTVTATPTTSPSVPTVPPTTSVIPTPSNSPDQIAALEVVEKYSAALAKIRSDPSKHDQYKMLEILKPLAFDDVIQANLNGVRPWRDKGWHETGATITINATASAVDQLSRGTVRVNVTTCRDQRDVVVLNKNGKPVNESDQLPDFVRRTYDVRQKAGSSAFKVYESGGEEVASCAA